MFVLFSLKSILILKFIYCSPQDRSVSLLPYMQIFKKKSIAKTHLLLLDFNFSLLLIYKFQPRVKEKNFSLLRKSNPKIYFYTFFLELRFVDVLTIWVPIPNYSGVYLSESLSDYSSLGFTSSIYTHFYKELKGNTDIFIYFFTNYKIQIKNR